MTQESCFDAQAAIGPLENPFVLVVEDDISVSGMLVMALRFLGFEVYSVATGNEAIEAVRERRPDVVLLDGMLPDLDGTEVCRRLRVARDYTPVLFLSARTTVEDKCHALAMGGDDYVTKPFDIFEVGARIRALVRRAQGPGMVRGADRGAAAVSSSSRLRVAGIELNHDTREAWLHGEPVPLSATEFDLLSVLMRNAGQVITKAQILDTVWKHDFQGESGVVETYVYYLRRKLGDSGRSLIRTVRGVGYMVHADTAEAEN
ncbi:response regulator transcription factor [Streptomyces sp. NPDC058457]|uniref:response regulator transcription factor n=1 Tax=Streptomyces sp. NPDC058457 TaxID=3346507 RepID=UPI0036658DA9